MVGEGKIKCKFFFSGLSYPFDVGRFWPSQVHFQKMGEGVTWREEYTIVSIESTSRGHHRWHFSKYNILRNGGGNLSRVLYYNDIVFLL